MTNALPDIFLLVCGFDGYGWFEKRIIYCGYCPYTQSCSTWVIPLLYCNCYVWCPPVSLFFFDLFFMWSRWNLEILNSSGESIKSALGLIPMQVNCSDGCTGHRYHPKRSVHFGDPRKFFQLAEWPKNQFESCSRNKHTGRRERERAYSFPRVNDWNASNKEGGIRRLAPKMFS